MRYALLLMISTCAFIGTSHAQVQGNLPNVIDSLNNDAVTCNGCNQLALPENVAVNDTLDVCVVTHDTNQYSVTDTLGNTYTLTTTTATPGSGGGENPPTLVYHAYTRSAFSGADTITLNFPGWTGTNQKIAVARYQHLNGVDGAVATGTFVGNGSGGFGTISTTQTTTVNNDVLSSCGAPGTFGTAVMLPDTTEYLTWGANQNGNRIFMSQFHAGAAGSQTVTQNTYNDFAFGGHDSFAMQTLAFKPDAIAIPDTQLPDVGSGIAYFAQLHCVGGTAAQSWTHVSGVLPTGLSFNTANGQITGSTTSTGTTSQGFTCTDGTSTSATATLSLRVNASLNFPVVRSFVANTNDVNGVWGSIGASCNDIILVLARGDDTHYREGWLQTASGTNTFIKDSFGSPVRRIGGFIPGTEASPWSIYVIGPLNQTGTDIVTLQSFYGSAANIRSVMLDISGGEVVDPMAGVSTMTNTATGSFGTSITTLVPNEIVVSAAMTATNPSPAPTMTIPAFNLVSFDSDFNGTSLYTYSSGIATPQSVSGTVSFTHGATDLMEWSQVLIPIRPAPSLVSCPLAAGEQILEWVY